MTPIELDELGPAAELPLTPGQGQMLARSGVVSAAPSPYTPGQWQVGPAGKVGAARIGDIEILIKPKVLISRLLFLLGYSQHGAAWQPEAVPLAEAADLVPAIAQARPAYARVPRPTRTGTSLRQTARLLAAAADISGQPTQAWLTLIVQLAVLAEAVAELRYAQRHAAQAAAARSAVGHLHNAHGRFRHAGVPRPPQPRTPADRVRLDFPMPLRQAPSEPGAPGTDSPARRRPRPPHRPRAPGR